MSFVYEYVPHNLLFQHFHISVTNSYGLHLSVCITGEGGVQSAQRSEQPGARVQGLVEG